MMNCPKCNKQIPEQSTVCEMCGANIIEPVVPHRRENSMRATIAALVFVGIILFAVFYPLFLRAREPMIFASCMNSIKEMAIAVTLYANDYDKHMPRSSEWCNLVQKHVKNKEAYQCPMARRLKCGYAMNSNPRVIPDDDNTASDTVMLFESDRGWNAHGGADAMLTKPRHTNFSVTFMDSHVNPVSVDDRKNLKW